MTEIISIVRRVAHSDTPVLITGESGTGKEVIADIIHFLSPRAKNQIVKINCSAIPETLMESELFGHVRGAFTGAVSDRKGRFEEANHGTIFLDEIGDISPLIQVKLLRFLQNHTFEAVGSNKTHQADVRIIAATNKNLERLIEEGNFREDLYYRLNVIPISLPPLRERKEDIPTLIERHLSEFDHLHKTSFTHAAIMKMINYNWPGNIRQLRNIIQRCITLARASIIDINELSPEIVNYQPQMLIEKTGIMTLEEVEIEYIIKILRLTKGNQTEAANLLGIHRNTLANKIREFHLENI